MRWRTFEKKAHLDEQCARASSGPTVTPGKLKRLAQDPLRAWARARGYRREEIAGEHLFLVELLPLEFDFGQADYDVVIRPLRLLIVEVSNHG